MRVLLGLGGVQLAEAVTGEHLGERVGDLLLGERDRAVEVVGVARHRHEVDAELDEALGELAPAVGPEVEEDRAVARGVEPRPALEHDRLDELVGDARRVARLDRGDRDRRPRVPTPSTIAASARSVRSQRWSRSIA